MTNFKKEIDLLDPLLDFLESYNRVDDSSLICTELYWSGRRVDFATLNSSEKATAYELKLSNNRRAIEQAAYNKLVFDQSYIVTATAPSDSVIDFAKICGVGIILLKNETTTIELESNLTSAPLGAKAKLLNQMKKQGMAYV